jgi:hypothetical protein
MLSHRGRLPRDMPIKMVLLNRGLFIRRQSGNPLSPRRAGLIIRICFFISYQEGEKNTNDDVITQSPPQSRMNCAPGGLSLSSIRSIADFEKRKLERLWDQHEPDSYLRKISDLTGVV